MRRPEPTKPGLTPYEQEQIRIRRIPRGERRNMAREFRRQYPRSERMGHTISHVEHRGPKEDEWEVSDG